jgi:hypothetical protein
VKTILASGVEKGKRFAKGVRGMKAKVRVSFQARNIIAETVKRGIAALVGSNGGEEYQGKERRKFHLSGDGWNTGIVTVQLSFACHDYFVQDNNKKKDDIPGHSDAFSQCYKKRRKLRQKRQALGGNLLRTWIQYKFKPSHACHSSRRRFTAKSNQ